MATTAEYNAHMAGSHDRIVAEIASDDSWRETVDQRYRDHLSEKLVVFRSMLGITPDFLTEVEQQIEHGTAGLDLVKVETMLRSKAHADKLDA